MASVVCEDTSRQPDTAVDHAADDRLGALDPWFGNQVEFAHADAHPGPAEAQAGELVDVLGGAEDRAGNAGDRAHLGAWVDVAVHDERVAERLEVFALEPGEEVRFARIPAAVLREGASCT